MTSIKIAEFDPYSQEEPSEPLTRQYFRQAVSEAAERAKATLPQAVNGRIDKAVQIVLAGFIEMLSDGRAIVGSQSQAAVQYVVNGTCECPDSQQPETQHPSANPARSPSIGELLCRRCGAQGSNYPA